MEPFGELNRRVSPLSGGGRRDGEGVPGEGRGGRGGGQGGGLCGGGDREAEGLRAGPGQGRAGSAGRSAGPEHAQQGVGEARVT